MDIVRFSVLVSEAFLGARSPLSRLDICHLASTSRSTLRTACFAAARRRVIDESLEELAADLAERRERAEEEEEERRFAAQDSEAEALSDWGDSWD